MSTLKVDNIVNLNNEPRFQPVLGTAQATTSGTAITFTGIPPWVNRITINLYNVTTSATAAVIAQLGTASGLVTSGYVGRYGLIQHASPSTLSALSTGFVVAGSDAFTARNGSVVITRLTGTIWVAYGVVSSLVATHAIYFVGGNVDAGGVVDRVTLIAAAGQFSGGMANILYE